MGNITGKNGPLTLATLSLSPAIAEPVLPNNSSLPPKIHDAIVSEYQHRALLWQWASDSKCLPGYGLELGTCSQCQAGSYSEGGAVACQVCKPGTFQPSRGATSCYNSPPNYYIPQSGAKYCCSSPCPSGMYSVGGAVSCEVSKPQQVYCSNPLIPERFNGFNVGSHASSLNHTIKIIVYPPGGDTGGGLGNFLVFWPALYYFAAFTDRKIVIADNSILGEFCRSVKCGTQMLSTIIDRAPHFYEHHYPRDKRKWSNSAGKEVRKIRMGSFMSHLSGETPLYDEVVSVEGFKSSSNWWMKFPGTIQCVQQLTSCSYDPTAQNMLQENATFIRCTEKFALQRFIIGPIFSDGGKLNSSSSNPVKLRLKNRRSSTQRSSRQLRGIGDNVVIGIEDKKAPIDHTKKASVREASKLIKSYTNSIVGLPSQLLRVFYTHRHKAIKVVDVGIHLRMQFKGFELLKNLSSYSTEVKSFLVSKEKEVVFQQLSDRVLSLVQLRNDEYAKDTPIGQRTIELTDILPSNNSRKKFIENYNSTSRSRPFVIFVSSDNEEVKLEFVSHLSGYLNETLAQVSSRVSAPVLFHVFYRSAGNISHCKRFEEMTQSNSNAVSHLTFDWYALSLARRLIAYRMPTAMASTFVQSALLLNWESNNVVDYRVHSLYVVPKPESSNVTNVSTFMVQWSRYE